MQLVSLVVPVYQHSWTFRPGRADALLLARSEPAQTGSGCRSAVACVEHERRVSRESAPQRFAGRTAHSDSESGALATPGERFVHSPADQQENEDSSYEDA